MVYQKEEISEIFFVPYNKLKEMVKKKEPDLLIDTFEEEIETPGAQFTITIIADGGSVYTIIVHVQ